MEIKEGIFKNSISVTEAKSLSSTRSTPNSSRPSSVKSSLETLTPELVNKSRVSNLCKKVLSPDNKKDEKIKAKKENDEKMKKAILKMQKLDKILLEKLKKEREIKLQRLQTERQLHLQIATNFKQEDGKTPSQDVVNNQAKYLALLPSLPKLEVLIEQCESESISDFNEPFFQTQLQEDDFINEKNVIKKTKREKLNVSKESNKQTKENKSVSDKDATTDFIKRNIELAKDAGNMVQMTKEEKERLAFLLQDIEENDGKDCLQVTTTEFSGYEPDSKDKERLEEINKMIKFEDFSFVDDDSSVISSLPPTVSDKGVDLKSHSTLKTDLIEVFNHEKYQENIEKKLQNLDSEWKQKFAEEKVPKLNEETLQQLLAECKSRDFSAVQSQSSICDHSGSEDELRIDNVLSRDQLDGLLNDARNCLGLPMTSSGDEIEDGNELNFETSDETGLAQNV